MKTPSLNNTVIAAAKTLASYMGAGDIANLLLEPMQQQAAINKLVNEHLLADPRQQPPSDLKSTGLLQPQYQIVPFQSDADSNPLVEAYSWCTSPTKLAVRLYTGASGRGKTRFAIELCGKLRDNKHPHITAPWCAGLLDALALANHPATIPAANPFDVLFATAAGRCIVVDYAESKKDAVQQLLLAAVACYDAHHENPDYRTRIILLARDYNEVLQGVFKNDRLKHRGVVEIKAAALPAIRASQELFSKAYHSLCRHLERQATLASYPAELFAQSKAQEQQPDAGIVCLAALLAAQGVGIQNVDANTILEAALNHEYQLWKKTAEAYGIPAYLRDADGNPDVLYQVATVLTSFGLQGAIPYMNVGVAIVQRLPLLAQEKPLILQKLVRVFADLYPQPNGSIAGVVLDLLGDYLIQRQLIQNPELIDALYSGDDDN